MTGQKPPRPSLNPRRKKPPAGEQSGSRAQEDRSPRGDSPYRERSRPERAKPFPNREKSPRRDSPPPSRARPYPAREDSPRRDSPPPTRSRPPVGDSPRRESAESLPPQEFTLDAGDTQTLFGQKACLAVFRHRPEAIVRVYHTAVARKVAAPLLSWAAAQHIPYRELPPEDMVRAAGSPHHEGLALAARPLRLAPLDGVTPEGVWLALDGVENPYNQGAILRTAAFFGLNGVIIGGARPGDKLNAAAWRSSEGGAEGLALYGEQVLSLRLAQWRKEGVFVAGLETGGKPLPGTPPGPLVLALGSEAQGLSTALRKTCSEVWGIAPLPSPEGGPAAVTSLNVSVAAAIAMAWARRG
ncbi:MAG: hypothetical protein OEV94_02570 [Deltaproteobacteria bacterium]|nr:hypothetical protein [Deltaproteobacteria bacterium]